MVRTNKVFGGCFRVPKRGKVAPSGNGDGVFTINYLSSTSTLDIASAPAPPPTPAPEMQARHSLLWHLLLDLPILLTVAGICVLLEMGVVPSHRAGFTCHDPALSFPYSGETFSIPMLAVLTLLVPFLTIWIAEATQCQQSEYMLKRRVCVSARATGLVFRNYLYGAVMNVALLEVVKCAVGSPRPTFFDLCEPDKEKTCNGSEFVTEYKCTSQRYSRYLIIDSSRSFPSAHASLAVYCGFFVAWYLQRRVFSWHSRSALLVPLVQLLALSFAAVSALSRVSDRRHHWWDVLAGAFAGFCTLLYTVLVLCQNFYQPGVESTSDLSSDNNHPSVRRLLASDTRVAIA